MKLICQVRANAESSHGNHFVNINSAFYLRMTSALVFKSIKCTYSVIKQTLEKAYGSSDLILVLTPAGISRVTVPLDYGKTAERIVHEFSEQKFYIFETQ